VLAVGSDLESSRAALACASRYDDVYAAVGVHPHEAGKFRDEAAEIEALLDEPKVVAIGEIGIDRVSDGWGVGVQTQAFCEQLAWAQKRKLPVSIHNRDADSDVLSALRDFSVVAVLHCFTSSAGFAAQALKAGCVLSFAGNLTFPKAASLREVARGVPADSLLIESDAPVLAPQPWRGQRNEPARVFAVCETLAEIRGVHVETAAKDLWETAKRVFKWGEA
jgi:TatD DNase family protein